MAGCIKWYHVWRGPTIDQVFEKKIDAKKHAAWLHYTVGGGTWWRNRVTVTVNGEDVDYSDYKFYNGESRKVKN
jgi:hypothetical protein